MIDKILKFLGPGRSGGWKRILAAVLLAPLLGSFLATVLWCIPFVVWAMSEGRSGGAFSIEGLQIITVFFVYGLIFSYPAIVILGLPVVFILKTCRMESGIAYVVLGAIGGLIVPFLIIPLVGGPIWSSFNIVLLMVFYAVAIAAVAWAIAREPKAA